MLKDKIEFARVEADLKLSELCRAADVNYHTLSAQMRRGSPIPFDTVDAIAQTLDLPLDFFSSRPRHIDQSIEIANRIAQQAAKLVASSHTADRPDVATLWQKLSDANYSLSELGSLTDHIDLYDPLSAESCIPIPCAFGRKSLARDYLKINSTDQYHRRMASLSPDIKARAMRSHANANHQSFQVDPEIIREEIEGEFIYGCYLRATARVSDEKGTPKTAIMTQFVARFPAQIAA